MKFNLQEKDNYWKMKQLKTNKKLLNWNREIINYKIN